LKGAASRPIIPARLFRVPVALHGDLAGGLGDDAQAYRRQLSEVLVQPLQFLGEGRQKWIRGR
jgi:hypothetical protein